MEQDTQKEAQGVQELLRHRENQLGIPPHFDMGAQPMTNGGGFIPPSLPPVQPAAMPPLPSSWPIPSEAPPVVDLTKDDDMSNLFAPSMQQQAYPQAPMAPQATQLQRPFPGAFADLVPEGPSYIPPQIDHAPEMLNYSRASMAPPSSLNYQMPQQQINVNQGVNMPYPNSQQPQQPPPQVFAQISQLPPELQKAALQRLAVQEQFKRYPPEIQQQVIQEFNKRRAMNGQVNPMLLAQQAGAPLPGAWQPNAIGQPMQPLQGRPMGPPGSMPALYPGPAPPPSARDMNLETLRSVLLLRQAQAHAQAAGRPLPLRPPVPAPAQPAIGSKKQAEDIIREMGIVGSLADIEMDPATWEDAYLDTVLLPHQKAALVWMSRREKETAQPIGGILADDQGLGKTVTTIALIASNPRSGMVRAVAPPAKPKQTENQPPGAAAAAGGSTNDQAGPSSAAAAGGDTEVVILDDDIELVEEMPGGAGAFPAAEIKQESAIPQLPPPMQMPNPEIMEVTAPLPAAHPAPGSSSQLEYGTLVVCPTTLLHQWDSEVRSKYKNARSYIYHGKSKGVSAKLLVTFDVVITTYQTLVLEMPESKKPQTRKGAQGGDDIIDLVDDDDEAPAGKGAKKRKRDIEERGGPLFKVMWHRVVLDEAQMIKNSRTMAAHAAWALRARRRWCLSGTPIQNSIDDLFSYFKFLRYDPYSKLSSFKELIKDPIASEDPDGFRRLNAILQTVLLRRTKQSTDDAGNRLIPLPERNVRLVQKEFTPEERKFYMALSDDADALLKRYQAEGTTGANYVNMLWMLLRMRQACNHPMLVQRKLQSGSGQQHKNEVTAARKLKPDLRTKLAETLRTGLTECVICFDVPEDPVVSVCDHIFCRQCVSAQLSMAGQGAAEEELAFHCPSCGHTLGNSHTFGADALNVHDQEGNGSSQAPIRADGSSTKIDALMDVLKELREPEPAVINTGPVVKNLSQKNLKDEMTRYNNAGQAHARASGSRRPANSDSKPLKEKVIVFSQWTSMLDLIEAPLRREKIEYRRLDGAMTVAARQTAIKDFTEDQYVSVMLVSLKAASLGVNLVSANHVVLMDLWYNPSTENQAIDRAHRIGQSKDVQVTRITIKDSVEDRILELQEKKKQIVESALGEGVGSGTGARLSAAEVFSLFGGYGR